MDRELQGWEGLGSIGAEVGGCRSYEQQKAGTMAGKGLGDTGASARRIWGMWDLWLGRVWGRGSGPQLTQGLQVGWTPVNLVRKLLEKGNRVTLVLKKIPLDLPGSPPSPREQVSDPSAPSPAPVPHWAGN